MEKSQAEVLEQFKISETAITTMFSSLREQVEKKEVN